MSCFVLDKITCKLPQRKKDISKLVLPSDVTLADKDFHEPSNIHILIGADVFFQVLLSSEPARALQPPTKQSTVSDATKDVHYPTLLNTQFGHVIAGNVAGPPANQVVSLFCTNCDSDLDDTLTRFWQAESVPEVFKECSSEHNTCEEIFKEHVQLKDNKFEVALPLKLPLTSVNETLGDSLHLALKRFYNLEARLHKDPVLFDLYKNFIHEYIELDHATKIDINQYDLNTDPVYFLPHHPVVRMDKKTTKCRTVFDGSMKTNKKISLNDILLNGDVVQSELFDILMLFRFEEFVFVTDIKHMFRAVSLNPKYRSLQNILWRESPEKEVDCIQLNTVTYGLKSSSYLATRCLLELAERYEDQFPKAAFILKKQTYVDDILATDSSLTSLIESKEQLCKLLDLGGFQLHKWSSNRVEVLHDVPTSKQYFDEIDLQKNNVHMKTLGINYDIKADCLLLAAPKNDTIPNTKRSVLSFISKFYDPLGLAGPIVVKAKVIMQKLWQARMDWDSVLHDELQALWHEFYESLAIMKPININRYTNLQNAQCLQLIGFADASGSSAYGCCVYLRVVDCEGNVKISLLCSKSRVNPLSQQLTVPRLELNAALLLAKLVTRVHKNLSLKATINSTVLYSDSQIVLAWIGTNTAKLNTYVANRVKEISKLTDVFTWAYVNTTDNPADCLSRGVLPHDLEQHHLWWKAPDFLYDRCYAVRENEVPVIDDLPEVKGRSGVSEFSSVMVGTNTTDTELSLDFLYKYSDISKMQRVLAYILRFCRNARTISNKTLHPFLTSSELNDSLLLILKHEQQIYMKDDIICLQKKDCVKGSLKALYPFIDDRGLIRVGGRLQNANIPQSQKHQIVLPRGSLVTKLIIANEHVKNLHAGQRLVLSSLNQKYWIVNSLREIKKVIHKCIICFKLKKNVSQQLMGSLPHDRVNVCRPFQKIGIDFAGPITVKQSRIRKSVQSTGYICVIVCFVTKALHLELLSDITTDSFLACFSRFISRRGLPTDVYCDNASTFKCAKTKLDDFYKLQASKEHQTQVQSFSASKGIRFHYIPCYSPVFGGLWESSVKSVKFHLKRVVQRALLTYEQLATVLCKIEAVLNSRPLVPMSNDVNDYSYLSPGHFLIGTALNSYPEQDLSNIPENKLKFWNVCTSMQQSFWKMWHKHYLNLLQYRPKWRDPVPNIEVGSLVILHENNTPPMYWPMARVISVFPGTDNHVRAVEVRTANGRTHTRSVTRLSVLPIDNNN
ncbi:hypothetical protein ABMA27_003083 [Loxostege sticticalis]|uniref:Integrase catalytic domain-containing protein n=1 Tax=Loxostege sticticalis TaxID=481309 RepID=A0ABR3HS31_LOXSC